MEPRIQYAKTSDGVSIAYSVLGEGPTLVSITSWGGVHMYSQFAPTRADVDQLIASRWQVIRYDGRGLVPPTATQWISPSRRSYATWKRSSSGWGWSGSR